MSQPDPPADAVAQLPEGTAAALAQLPEGTSVTAMVEKFRPGDDPETASPYEVVVQDSEGNTHVLRASTGEEGGA